MNILLDLITSEIRLLRKKLNMEPVNEKLIIKFERAVDNGVNGLFNWIEITEDTKDIPDGVIYGTFSSDPKSINPTHYYVPIEAGE